MAKVGEDLVFLDVGQDAYVCLAGGASIIVRRSYGLDIGGDDLGPTLLEAGLITDRFGSSDPTRHVPTPAGDLITSEEPPPRVRIGDYAAMAASILAMARRYRGRSLSDMIGHAARRGEGPGRWVQVPSSPEVLERARIFDRLLPWAPAQEACLYRSFMLLLFLRDQGAEVAWVFGVRTWPFEAHCWVQAGGLVLNDAADHVRGFTPILVA
jgi:hypothetical protein